MLAGMPNVRFLIIDKPRTFKDYLTLRNTFKRIHFDILLAAQASLRTNLIYPLIKAKRKIGFDTVRAKDLHQYFVSESIEFKEEHLADGFMQFAYYVGAQNNQFNWYINSEKGISQSIVASYKPSIVINIAASKKERTWPAKHYVQLIQRLIDQVDCYLILVGGSSALDRLQEKEILSHVHAKTLLNLIGKTSISELVALLRVSEVLISPDSGPIHMATALNIPVVGLFAVARPELSGPYAALEFTVNKYPEAVQCYLGKSPHQVKWHERVHDERAMQLISVEEVYDAALKALDSNKRSSNLFRNKGK
ncbi:glycosyltransferase family 9 protein [Alteromonas sp. D210916BOD_24]